MSNLFWLTDAELACAGALHPANTAPIVVLSAIALAATVPSGFEGS